MFRNHWLPTLLALSVPGGLLAQSATQDTTVRVTLGGFVDGYYAWDFGRPPTFDRSFAGGTPFTTQPTRHNEFNVNLAFVDMKLEGERIRGRLALQVGTSVQSNYSGEPSNGAFSGSSLARHIQEAVVGVQLAPSLWVDGGVFFSHMGMEGWISRDNPTYSRSLVADYSPYYQSRVKLTWSVTSKLTARFDVVNGWQNISENNSGKGAGIRLDLAATPTTTLMYCNFFSDEAGNRLRSFTGVGFKAALGATTLLGELDVGSQGKSSARGGTASWYGFTAVIRHQLRPMAALSGRLERFDDKDQVVIVTGSNSDGGANPAFRANGASIGLDVTPQRRVLWRTEFRGFNNRASLFPDGRTGAPKKMSAFVVSSLALTL